MNNFTNCYRAVTKDGRRVIETSVLIPDITSPYGQSVAWVDVETLITGDDDAEA